MERKKKDGPGLGFLLAGLAGVAIGAVGALFASELTSDDKKNKKAIKQKAVSQPVQQTQQKASTRREDFGDDIICPITQEIMKDPYIIKNCGHTFEKTAILECIQSRPECPVCRVKCTTNDIIQNYSLKNIIQEVQKAKH